VPLKYWDCVHIGLLVLSLMSSISGTEKVEIPIPPPVVILSLHDSSLVQVYYVPLIFEAAPSTHIAITCT
jgi:hypothetical protein